ncbi:MAG TPA: hypothetical protein ENJ95_15775 [Bacteroidetes bacterium]|nr:hypothetical protein [Bacteroidota bacterium]
MIRNLLKLVMVILIGVLVYNYFLGTPDEKEGAKKIFREVKDVAVGVKDLVKSEKKKFDAGKYDKAVDKIGGLLHKLKLKADKLDEKYVKRIQELEKTRKDLKDALYDYEDQDGKLKTEEDTKNMTKDLDKLLEETQSLIDDMEKEEN